MTAAPLPRHSRDHRSPLPARAPEIAVPSMTDSRRTPHGHDEADDAIEHPSRSPIAEAALRSLSPATIITLASDSPRRQGAADPGAEPDIADPRTQATRPPGPPPATAGFLMPGRASTRRSARPASQISAPIHAYWLAGAPNCRSGAAQTAVQVGEELRRISRDGRGQLSAILTQCDWYCGAHSLPAEYARLALFFSRL